MEITQDYEKYCLNRLWLVPAVLFGSVMVVLIGFLASNTSLRSSEFLDQPEHPIQSEILATNSSSPVSSLQDSGGYNGALQSCSLPTSYPENILKWCHLIEQAANKTALPASLIAAVILQESSGDPLAYSSSGAVGLMQVMPRDGKASLFVCINGPCFSSRPTIQELQDPAFNVAYGSKMLAELFNRYGSYREALFRYGPKDIGYAYADIVLNHWEKHQ
jgi:hypothetical protein